MVVGVTAVILVVLACVTRSSSAGSLGVALTTILAMTNQLKSLIHAWTRAETSLGGVARAKEYEAKTLNENPPRREHEDYPDDSWPKGSIRVDALTVKYREGDEEHFALRNVSFNIEAGRKLGICGRTGRSVLETHIHD
jgi:ATP-binding cassette subfamily C (CFTR/MRP) protein 1